MLGIVILNYNTWDITAKCVQSVTETCILHYKIYIVDNHSPNSSYESLSKIYNSNPNIIVIRSDVNGGFAKGNNIGVRAAILDGCEYIIITNNDVIFCDNCIQLLNDFIHNSPQTVIVGPRLYKPSGGIYHSITMQQNSYLEYLGFRIRSNFYQLNEENIIEATKVYAVSGCCFIVRSKEFVEMGAFDEGTFLYNEESILSFQASRSNYKTYFLPSATVIHNHGATTGKQSFFINGEFLKSGLYYWRKYRKINILKLILMWIVFTSRTLTKSVYCEDLIDGMGKYIKETWKALWEAGKND
jgi:GT2 family glycosyltransferase